MVLKIQTATPAETSVVRISVEGRIKVLRNRPHKDKDGSLSGRHWVELEGVGFTESVQSPVEVPEGFYEGVRCLGRVSKDRFGRAVWNLAVLDELKDAGGSWVLCSPGTSGNAVEMPVSAKQAAASTGPAVSGAARPAGR